MDPRDRLWTELIFPHCEVAALLALRAACRAFLVQLNAAPARLWLSLTMELARMSYAERVLGWPGVERATTRERNTRANCDAGRFTQGPVLHLPGVLHLRCSSGRLAAFFDGSVQLLDADSGARLASFDIATLRGHEHAVLDRWIPFVATDGRVLLLDLVAARLVKLAPPSAASPYCAISVAGRCVSFHRYGRAGGDGRAAVAVVHVSDGLDGATVVREVARVSLANDHDEFALCERGRSFVLYDIEDKTLQLVNLATGQPVRAFTPRTCVGLRLFVVMLTHIARAIVAGFRVAGCRFLGECDFVVASVIATTWWQSSGYVAFRISGNACFSSAHTATSTLTRMRQTVTARRPLNPASLCSAIGVGSVDLQMALLSTMPLMLSLAQPCRLPPLIIPRLTRQVRWYGAAKPALSCRQAVRAATDAFCEMRRSRNVLVASTMVCA
jgi:hypothetical protein